MYGARPTGCSGRRNGRPGCILAELLDLLELSREVVGKGILEGLYIRKKKDQLAKQINQYQSYKPARTYLGLASRLGAQTVEGSGLHSRLSSQRGTKSRGSKTQ